VLGPQQVLALTAISDFFPRCEQQESRVLVQQIGVRQQTLEIDLLAVHEVAENGPRRCYHCKRELFTLLLQTAQQQGFQTLLDGSNLDDLSDYRPGRQALEELQIRSPLLDVKLNKQEIRDLSSDAGLPTWNKPSFACLASRIPYGNEITSERLQQVERCEKWLREQNIRNYRVRHHEHLARIELAEEDINRLLDQKLRRELIAEFKAAGFSYVTLDLQGYRTGSLNETLPDR